MDNFKSSNTGEEAFSVRVGLGTLIIKTRLAISDEETVNQITENPYLQYFLGFPRFIEENGDPQIVNSASKEKVLDFMKEALRI